MVELRHFGSITVKHPASEGDLMAVLATLRDVEREQLARMGGAAEEIAAFAKASRRFAGFRKGKLLAVCALYDTPNGETFVAMARSRYALAKENVVAWLKNYPAMFGYIRKTHGEERRYYAAVPQEDAAGFDVLCNLLGGVLRGESAEGCKIVELTGKAV